MLVHRVRGLLGATVTVLAIGTAAVTPSSAAAHASSHHVKHHHVNGPTHSGIPQHNGGDRDADNNGGPSDGDGNV